MDRNVKVEQRGGGVLVSVCSDGFTSSVFHWKLKATSDG